MFPYLQIVFVDAQGSFGASALFEDKPLPWVASEPPNVGAQRNGDSAGENLHFPRSLLVGTRLS